MNVEKLLKPMKYTFTLIGAASLALAIYLLMDTRAFLDSAAKAQGTVLDFEVARSSKSTSYYPIVAFRDTRGERITFTSSTGSYPPAYSRGEAVTVLYAPTNPGDAQLDGLFSLWGGTLISGLFAVIFGGVGVGMLAWDRKKRRKTEDLKAHGVEVMARFQSVELNTGFSVNGRNPFRILCHWKNPNTGEGHLFTSDNLWFDPTRYITSDTVPVLIDEKNPDRYWVNTSFLPRVAG